MEVIVIESETFNQILNRLAAIEKFCQRCAKAAEQKNDARYMSVKEVAEYMGYSEKWVSDHKDDFGFMQVGKDLRFWKPTLDTFLASKTIKPRKI